MTEMQRQFERWAVTTKDKFGLPFFTIKDESGKYIDHAAEISWQAWQASRAELVVSLPEPMWSESQGDEVVFYDSIKNELERIGVRYE